MKVIALLIMTQAATCLCAEPRYSSHVVLDEHGQCIYWYYDDEPEKHNPCIDIPGNATPIWSDDE